MEIQWTSSGSMDNLVQMMVASRRCCRSLLFGEKCSSSGHGYYPLRRNYWEDLAAPTHPMLPDLNLIGGSAIVSFLEIPVIPDVGWIHPLKASPTLARLPDTCCFLPTSNYLKKQNTMKFNFSASHVVTLNEFVTFEQASAQQTQIGQPFTAESGAASGAAPSAQYGQHARAQLQYSVRQSGAA